MSDNKTRRTATGRSLTEEELDDIAAEVEETAYDVGVLKTRRRGRPPMGSGPADVVPVRIDPELKAAIEARAQADHTHPPARSSAKKSPAVSSTWPDNGDQSRPTILSHQGRLPRVRPIGTSKIGAGTGRLPRSVVPA